MKMCAVIFLAASMLISISSIASGASLKGAATQSAEEAAVVNELLQRPSFGMLGDVLKIMTSQAKAAMNKNKAAMEAQKAAEVPQTPAPEAQTAAPIPSPTVAPAPPIVPEAAAQPAATSAEVAAQPAATSAVGAVTDSAEDKANQEFAAAMAAVDADSTETVQEDDEEDEDEELLTQPFTLNLDLSAPPRSAATTGMSASDADAIKKQLEKEKAENKKLHAEIEKDKDKLNDTKKKAIDKITDLKKQLKQLKSGKLNLLTITRPEKLKDLPAPTKIQTATKQPAVEDPEPEAAAVDAMYSVASQHKVSSPMDFMNLFARVESDAMSQSMKTKIKSMKMRSIEERNKIGHPYSFRQTPHRGRRGLIKRAVPEAESEQFNLPE